MPGTNDLNDPGVPNLGMPGGSESSNNGMPQNGGGDAGESEVEKLRAEIEKRDLDLRRLQSTLQRNLSEREKEWSAKNDELKRKMDAIAMQKMDDAEKLRYEADRAKEEAETLRQQLQAFRQQQEVQEQMKSYVDYYAQFGVSNDELDLSSPEALVNSGSQALLQKFQALKQNPSSAQTQTQQQTSRPNQRIVQGSGSPPSGKLTLEDLRASTSKAIGREISEEELFEMAERGQVNLNQLL